MDAAADLDIRKPESREEVGACSLLMSRTDPWLTLGRTCDDCLAGFFVLGSRMIGFAEELIFRISPNAFICVSDFNPRAKALCQRRRSLPSGWKPIIICILASGA